MLPMNRLTGDGMAQINTVQRHIIKKGEARPLGLPNGSTLLEVTSNPDDKAKLWVTYGSRWYEKEPEDIDVLTSINDQTDVLKLMLQEAQLLRTSLVLNGLIPNLDPS